MSIVIERTLSVPDALADEHLLQHGPLRGAEGARVGHLPGQPLRLAAQTVPAPAPRREGGREGWER